MSKKHKRSAVDVDGGQYAPVPIKVLRSEQFARLSFPAKAMLFELLIQHGPSMNGHYRVTSKNLIDKRGWRSNDTIARAKRELEEAGFIHKTCQGHRPNKASLYAVTWTGLSPSLLFDPGYYKAFRRGAWQGEDSLPKITVLRPMAGASSTDGRPNDALENPFPAPLVGAIRPIEPRSPTPTIGHHLEVPSGSAVSEQAGAVADTEQIKRERHLIASAAMIEAAERVARPKPKPMIEPKAVDEGNGVLRVRDSLAHDTQHWH